MREKAFHKDPVPSRILDIHATYIHTYMNFAPAKSVTNPDWRNGNSKENSGPDTVTIHNIRDVGYSRIGLSPPLAC